MSDIPPPPSAAADAPAQPLSAAPIPPPSSAGAWPATAWVAAAAVLLAALAIALSWNAHQRVKALESELVKRQQGSDEQATEARTLARQAELSSRDAAAKMALLEARVAENAMQRTQIEELIQSLARSRDENVLADLDAAVRVALQQSAITGSAEPLVLTLKQADERLARFNQPRLERVRRAVLQDADRIRSAGVVDISMLTLRLDEVMRVVDELPLLSSVDRKAGAKPAPASNAGVAANAPAAPDGNAGVARWAQSLGERWGSLADYLWSEVKSLVRVTRIDQPEAALVAPEQAYFLRENLKLRLLNARLSLLSRQFDIAQSDLRDAQAALDRYFDRSSRRVVQASESLRQVMTQARLVSVPRPDATLAAIATASAGR